MSNAAPQNVLVNSSDNMPMIVEIIFGLFGMMGMGWIYVGNFLVGGLLFFAWLMILAAAALLPLLFTAVTLGIGGFSFGCLCCLPLPGLLWSTVSGLFVKDYAAKRGLSGNPTNLIIAAVAGFVIICIAIITPFVLLGGVGVIMAATS